MDKPITEYQKEIEKVLRRLGMLSPALGMQIKSLASALRNLDMANHDIDSLECTTVWEQTRYGKKLAPHPVFKIAKEAQELVTRQMKALGLTAELLSVDVAEDPMVAVTKKIARQRENPVMIMKNEE